VLARRVEAGTYGRVLSGDLAYKHDNGACFAVEDASVEQARAESFEISPSGPLLGYRTSMPTGGEPLAIEQAVFAEAGLEAKDFRSRDLGRVRGARRPLRVQPKDVEFAAGVDEHGPHITVAFTLPAGAFATVVMRELMKAEALEDVETSAQMSATPQEDEA
jgi:tRNA pseudouridine13 synthase